MANPNLALLVVVLTRNARNDMVGYDLKFA